MIEEDRIITASPQSNEEVIDRAIRPKRLMDYVGQSAVKEQMEIYGFTHYKEFETRLKNYREIVMSEVL